MQLNISLSEQNSCEKRIFVFFCVLIQHRFICRPSNGVGRCRNWTQDCWNVCSGNHWAISHPHWAISHPHKATYHPHHLHIVQIWAISHLQLSYISFTPSYISSTIELRLIHNWATSTSHPRPATSHWQLSFISSTTELHLIHNWDTSHPQQSYISSTTELHLIHNCYISSTTEILSSTTELHLIHNWATSHPQLSNILSTYRAK
jgi:hypothetical protein